MEKKFVVTAETAGIRHNKVYGHFTEEEANRFKDKLNAEPDTDADVFELFAVLGWEDEHEPVYRLHETEEEALEVARENGVLAAAVKTFAGEQLVKTEYYSFEGADVLVHDLREEFPLTLGSNQTIEEIS